MSFILTYFIIFDCKMSFYLELYLWNSLKPELTLSSSKENLHLFLPNIYDDYQPETTLT